MVQTSPERRHCRPRCFTGSRAGWLLSRRPVGRVDVGGRRSAIRSAWPAPSAEDVARIGRDVRQRSRFLRRLCRLLPSRLRPAVAARAAPGVRGRSDVRVVLLSYVAHKLDRRFWPPVDGTLLLCWCCLLVLSPALVGWSCLLLLSAGLVCCSCLLVLSALVC